MDTCSVIIGGYYDTKFYSNPEFNLIKQKKMEPLVGHLSSFMPSVSFGVIFIDIIVFSLWIFEEHDCAKLMKLERLHCQ